MNSATHPPFLPVEEDLLFHFRNRIYFWVGEDVVDHLPPTSYNPEPNLRLTAVC